MQIKNKKKLTALITGGTRGIGRAVCLDIAKSFARKVIINYLQNDTEARKTAELVNEIGSEAQLIKANMAFPDEIDRMFNEINSVTDSIDMFVHCAAINSFKPLIDIKPNQWDLIMNVNARSFLLCVQKCLPLMNKGKIVAVSSLGSQTFVPNYGSLGPTKSALESIIRFLAVELVTKGIHVNGVTAGFVDTDSIKKFPDSERLIEYAIQRTPAGRIGKPQDVSKVVMFLLSPDSDWIYGQNIIADGGFTIY
jgi:enoyl-[acyl-carrier protein] reductase III